MKRTLAIFILFGFLAVSGCMSVTNYAYNYGNGTITQSIPQNKNVSPVTTASMPAEVAKSLASGVQ